MALSSEFVFLLFFVFSFFLWLTKLIYKLNYANINSQLVAFQRVLQVYRMAQYLHSFADFEWTTIILWINKVPKSVGIFPKSQKLKWKNNISLKIQNNNFVGFFICVHKLVFGELTFFLRNINVFAWWLLYFNTSTNRNI